MFNPKLLLATLLLMPITTFSESLYQKDIASWAAPLSGKLQTNFRSMVNTRESKEFCKSFHLEVNTEYPYSIAVCPGDKSESCLYVSPHLGGYFGELEKNSDGTESIFQKSSMKDYDNFGIEKGYHFSRLFLKKTRTDDLDLVDFWGKEKHDFYWTSSVHIKCYR